MRSVIIGFTVCIAAGPILSHAAVYRCTNEAGEVIFAQTPCPAGQQGEELNITVPKQNKEIDPAVCKEVRYLAELMFPHVAQEDSILKVYDDLGGRENLSAGITAVVNYVYNYHYNPKASEAEVLTLTYEKCLDKGFGYIGKNDLPQWDKIKYKVRTADEKKRDAQKRNETSPDPEQKQEMKEACGNYAKKLDYLREKLAEKLEKSEMLRLQTDKEYLEQQQKEQCGKKN